MMKRGQAAFEFLMTYGWALLVTLVAIGALAFFGVLNPGSFIPDRCTMFSGFLCMNYVATLGGVTPLLGQLRFTFYNGIGYAMNFGSIPGTRCALDINLCGIDVILAGVAAAQPYDGQPSATDCTSLGNSPGTSISYFPLAHEQSITCGYRIPNGTPAGTRLKGVLNMTWEDPQGNIRNRQGTFALTVEP